MSILPAGLPDHALEDLILVGARALPVPGVPQVNDAAPRYVAVPERRTAALDSLMQCASELLRRRALKGLMHQECLSSPWQVKDYLQAHFQGYEAEAFAVVFLSSHHKVIAVEEMFRGTLTQTSVYPREVVKRALALNAGAVFLAHNHPSGCPEPSRADECLTNTLKAALSLVDVRVLDHIVVAGGRCVSMAERGLI